MKVMKKQLEKILDEQWKCTDHYLAWKDWVVDLILKLQAKSILKDEVERGLKEMEKYATLGYATLKEAHDYGYQQAIKELREKLLNNN